MGQNAWLSGPATMEILFHTPAERRWQRAAAEMGVALDSLSNDIGHA
jgi:putative transcriptional regulator